MKNTYWARKGRHQKASDILSALIPSKGPVEGPFGEAIEVYRCMAKLYYDVYNNGGGNFSVLKDRSDCVLSYEAEIKKHLKSPRIWDQFTEMIDGLTQEAGSYVTYHCDECSGSGEVDCVDCSGDGVFEGEECSYCGGSGLQVCDTCDGKGQTEEWEPKDSVPDINNQEEGWDKCLEAVTDAVICLVAQQMDEVSDTLIGV